MTLSDLSIKRPVLATVLSIVIVLFGIIGFLRLGVREYPSVDPPVVTIQTDYTGANAEIIESQITEPLEEEINQVEGIKTLSSISSQGRSSITVEFELGIDLDNAANDVRSKVSQAVSSLPPDADPPVVSKADADAETILAITLKSDQRDLLELTDIADQLFAERLQTIQGVSEVYLWGEKLYAMRLVLDPDRMEAFSISPMDIQRALNNQNIELPTGRIEGRKFLTIRTFGRLQTEQEFNEMIIAERDSVLVRLEDVGRAELAPQNKQTILRGNGGEPMVGVAMQPQPGANYIEIVDQAFAEVEKIKQDLPEDIVLGVGLNTTTSIRRSIEEVQNTILVAFALVVIIIFIFLRNIRTTIIPIITIPISLIGTFGILYFAGYSINLLSLLGMLLATGLVVDDAIVVMENIYSRIEEGLNPIQAAFKGSRQVFFAVIATTITLVCVFLPIFFLQGLTGRLFREFAVVVAGSVLISTFVSLSLTAMLCSRMLKQDNKEYKFLQPIRRGIEWLINGYQGWLEKFMKKRWLAFPAVAIIGGLIWLFVSLIESELAPQVDKSSVRLVTTAPQGTSYDMMDTYQQKLIDLVDTLPGKENLLSVTSPTFGSSVSVNSGFVRLRLYPPQERERSQMELAEILSQEVKKYNFARTFVTQPPTISAGSSSGLPVQFVLQSPNLEDLREVIPTFMQRARQHPAFNVVDINLKFNKPELLVEINRSKAQDLGISVRAVALTLQTYFSEQRLGYFIKDGKQYYIIAQAERSERNEPADLAEITVLSKYGERVALDNLVTVQNESRPPQLLRYNRFTSATISASLAEGYTLGKGLDVMNQIADEVLDENFSTALKGQSEDYAESSSNLLIAFIFALLLVYLTLAAQFESFRDPFTIMFTVPLALAGALMSLLIFGQTLNIFSQIGMIVLIGIVTKNGILIVEFANQKRDAGEDLMSAAIHAATERFRPILMTSLATTLGALPLVISFGGSANSRIPLGIVIIGGLLFSLILTLFVIPSLYTYIASKSKRNVVEEA
ncbi:efflux RND transporter permease subunit [Catalinimonas sp. 4WD22]|uniref:efflux RND transporter permease subunit n=1 Tax=Catalinimonas locisalis TaxID=3133978 RepID=UPI003100FEB3